MDLTLSDGVTFVAFLSAVICAISASLRGAYCKLPSAPGMLVPLTITATERRRTMPASRTWVRVVRLIS